MGNDSLKIVSGFLTFSMRPLLIELIWKTRLFYWFPFDGIVFLDLKFRIRFSYCLTGATGCNLSASKMTTTLLSHTGEIPHKTNDWYWSLRYPFLVKNLLTSDLLSRPQKSHENLNANWFSATFLSITNSTFEQMPSIRLEQLYIQRDPTFKTLKILK